MQKVQTMEAKDVKGAKHGKQRGKACEKCRQWEVKGAKDANDGR